MLLNYAELVLVLTPARYNLPCPVNFQQPLYGLPRKRARAIRRWLVDHFELRLEPPVADGCDDSNRLGVLMLKSLVGQAHTLWDSVERRDEVGVLGPTYSHKGTEKEITSQRVLHAIITDLSSFSGFVAAWEDQLNRSVSKTYSWPPCPGSSRYVLTRKI